MPKDWEELFTPPAEIADQIPKWFINVLEGVKLADHLGDVWDSMMSVPQAWRPWIKSIIYAEYDSTTEKYV